MEEISATNSWRDGEFAKFKVNPHQVEESLWYRMCVPMIYANWEGFVVSALKMLLSHLNSLQLTPPQIPTKLVVVGLGDTYRSLSGKQSFEQRCTFTERFSGFLNATVKFQTKIATKSNLNSDVLSELCNMYSFDYSKFSDYESLLNRLVQVRNCIAHGENSIVPTKENIDNFVSVVQTMIDLLLVEIDVFMTSENYLSQH
ncbi:MAE_28990/MAE_18760 family HEPN-like nuclease [Serratia fonticola]|uniref:MAE_28990/MAE_18760 family HEPN-like nuclease n=1 Tax=Serratia fonticola TaxID=47917 RepID=UPI001576875C